jgi:hypothetical protein
MQKLLNYTLGISLFLFLLVGCQPYENTYAKSQKEIDAQIAEEKLVFDEYVSEALDKEEVYETDSIVKDTVVNTRASGCILLRNGFGNGKAILPGDQVGISYTYREIRRDETTQKTFEFTPSTTIVVPDSVEIVESPHNNMDDNDPYMVGATTNFYTTKTSPSGVATAIGYYIEKMREGDKGILIMSYISHGLPIPFYRSIVLDFKITYVQKQ